MNFGFILLTIILILLLWIIFVPVYLKLDTKIKQYEIWQSGTIKFSFHPGEKQMFKMRVLGINIPLKRKVKGKKEQPVKKKKLKKKRSLRAWIFLFREIAKSFRVNNIQCSIDTYDVLLNAQLVPLMIYMNNRKVHFSTNFMRENFIQLEVEGRLNKIIWAGIRFLFKQ